MFFVITLAFKNLPFGNRAHWKQFLILQLSSEYQALSSPGKGRLFTHHLSSSWKTVDDLNNVLCYLQQSSYLNRNLSFWLFISNISCSSSTRARQLKPSQSSSGKWIGGTVKRIFSFFFCLIDCICLSMSGLWLWNFVGSCNIVHLIAFFAR
jgi:hypothetical protein